MGLNLVVVGVIKLVFTKVLQTLLLSYSYQKKTADTAAS